MKTPFIILKHQQLMIPISLKKPALSSSMVITTLINHLIIQTERLRLDDANNAKHLAFFRKKVLLSN
jgi:hypothetical protein